MCIVAAPDRRPVARDGWPDRSRVSPFWQSLIIHLADQTPWAAVVALAIFKAADLIETWMVRTARYDMFTEKRKFTTRRGSADTDTSAAYAQARVKPKSKQL